MHENKYSITKIRNNICNIRTNKKKSK